MFRKWTIGKRRERTKNAADAFRIHNKWSHVVFWVRIRFEIRNIVADPFLLRLAPPDLAPFDVPRFSVSVARGAVVHDASICRPRPSPIWINAQTRRIQIGRASCRERG